jgi:hypothetical protein
MHPTPASLQVRVRPDLTGLAGTPEDLQDAQTPGDSGRPVACQCQSGRPGRLWAECYALPSQRFRPGVTGY